MKMHILSFSIITSTHRENWLKLLKTNSIGIAHGCTGKGNDQVRFEVAIKALNPKLKAFAPVREWAWSREEEIDYAIKHNIPVSINYDSPSIDQTYGES